jgi:hypothetical protein
MGMAGLKRAQTEPRTAHCGLARIGSDDSLLPRPTTPPHRAPRVHVEDAVQCEESK